jgi:hypothetical protein
MDKPKPVPLPKGLVVKKGSKMRDRTFSGIPEPLSARLNYVFVLENIKRVYYASNLPLASFTALGYYYLLGIW